MNLRNLLNISYSKLKNGSNQYILNNGSNWSNLESNLEVAQNHPILTPAILFLSKLFSQADFNIKEKGGSEELESHWLLDLLDNPNSYQTKTDFLESLMFTMISDGKAIVYMKRTSYLRPTSLHILRNELIEYDSNFKTSIFKDNNSQNIIYRENDERKTIRVKDLLFFYDLPNGLEDNIFKNRSRIDGLHQTLKNTNDSLIAKNIILKTNGKELISVKNATQFPLQPEEKEKIEEAFFNDYGLGFDRKRGIVTKADMSWQSMTVDLRSLGLDESIKVDGNIIYTALHIPKDILSLEAKKTTYNNYKESMVSFVQNEIQGSLTAITDVFNRVLSQYEDNFVLSGNYNNLPVMQFILVEKYQGITNRALALKNLLMAGIPKEVALKLCDFDENLELTDLLTSENNGDGNNSTVGTNDNSSGSTDNSSSDSIDNSVNNDINDYSYNYA